ncbi:hypothetical protein F2Q68_00021426 [Brassica cretica]|uniref:THIF-type NAD/FAD binding fold domain-containing protein n=2 Tax=Brassica cretica TaxID=69181 RepID=A0A8S9G001_BRACR|nr:hypothetical protein F2Q68_00021426 [Brassica cretica]KAF3569479.1 hypothetical protein DY000_02016661 [Brassica cretica]
MESNGKLHRKVTSCESLGTESTMLCLFVSVSDEIKATDPQDTFILIQIDLTTSFLVFSERYLLEKEITLTDEEKHRNNRICDMLFIATSHCLADFIFSLGNHCLQLSDIERIDVKLNFTSDLRRVKGVNMESVHCLILPQSWKSKRNSSVSERHIPDSLLERLISGTIEFPPACAIVGGILAQEVIKAVSGKGDPVKNFFYYDAQDGKATSLCKILLNFSRRFQSEAEGKPVEIKEANCLVLKGDRFARHGE